MERSALPHNAPERGEANIGGAWPAVLHRLLEAVLPLAVVLGGLVLISQYNYPLFHSLAEIICVAVAFGMAALVWNSRPYLDNSCILFLGIAYCFVAIVDLLHTLAYKGMGVFPGYDANLPTQLWIVARYVQSISLLIAPLFLRRRPDLRVVFAAYTLVVSLLLVALFYWRVFPDAYVEGVGLTGFKVASEYVISLILLAAIALLVRNRQEFDPAVLRLLVLSLAFTIASELAFTAYVSVYGPANLVGHLLKLVSFYLIYRAIIQTATVKPHSLLFRRLKQSEEALRQSEELYRILIDSADDAISVKDAEGRYLVANAEFARRLNRPKEDIVGKMPHDLYPPELALRVQEEDRRVLVAGDVVVSEDDAMTPQGRRASHQRKVPLRDRAGGVVGVLAISREITDQKKAEERMVRSQRMEMAAQVAGQVAHEFNNLLGPLVGYPDLIKMRLPAGHPAVPLCNAMLEAAQTMAAINDDLLLATGRGVPRMERVDLNRVVRQAFDQIGSTPPSLRVELDLCPDLRPVAGSPGHLARSVGNLITNGREAMGDVGLLQIRTENVDVDSPQGAGHPVPIGEYVRVTVSDTGHGIDPAIVDRVFEPFFTTRSARGRRAAGLGLSIVRAVVEDHQGGVDFESHVGQGTTFSLYLPVCHEALARPDGEEARGGAETVLVVEDDETQRDVIEEMLKTLGYRVATAGSGDQALDYLREHRVDLLVLDMVMRGGIDGEEIYRRALDLRPTQRAIIISGYEESEQVWRAQAVGAGAMLRKPVTLRRLARAVRLELERPEGARR